MAESFRDPWHQPGSLVGKLPLSACLSPLVVVHSSNLFTKVWKSSWGLWKAKCILFFQGLLGHGQLSWSPWLRVVPTS